MRVLLIEDNPKMASAIKRGLQDHGYSVDVCHTGIAGEDLSTVERYDIILLDVILPDRNGVDVCRNMRRRQVKAPVLMLSALSSVEDAQDGISAGADQYLSKPFEFTELVRAMQSLTDRAGHVESSVLVCDGVKLDLTNRRVTRDGQQTELSEKQCELLEYMMCNPNRAISEREIIQKVWNLPPQSASNVVDTYIAGLRKKLDDGSSRPVIHTVADATYRFGGVAPAPV